MKWRDILIGAGIATLLYYIFDEELQPVVDKSKGFLVGILGKDAETFNAGANGTAGVNEKGNVLIGKSCLSNPYQFRRHKPSGNHPARYPRSRFWFVCRPNRIPYGCGRKQPVRID